VAREVVGEVWRLFLARFWRTLAIVALLLAPLELGVAILDPDLTSSGIDWWAWVGVSAAVSALAFPWVAGALVEDVAETPGSPAAPYARTWRRLPDLLLSALVSTVGIVLGTVALIVPGLILAARWALIVPLVVLERASWRDALSRSNALVRGRTGSVAAIWVLVTALSALLAVPGFVLGAFVDNVLGAWISALAVNAVFLPLYAFAPFVLYRRLTSERLQSEPRCGVV
jgi:Membrane domain of glycerophosphoryl diester phosphodiesterase